MRRQRSTAPDRSGREKGAIGRRLLALAALVFAVSPNAIADPPAAPWVDQPIGSPRPVGGASVDRAGVWTIQGSGTDIWTHADSFRYTYQPLRGDGSISARFLKMQGGDQEWSRTGLMVRESDAPGAPNLNFAISPAHGLVATVRAQRDIQTDTGLGEVGPSNNLAGSRNLFLRLQRMGAKVVGYYSRDGALWTQAAFPAQNLPVLREEALLGMAVTSHKDREATTGFFDRVRVQPGANSVYDLIGSGGDRSALLQWPALQSTASAALRGYNVYRGPAGASHDQLVRIAERVSGASFADQGGSLTNGVPATYAVAPVLLDVTGAAVEGALVGVQVTPVPLPSGWFGSGIQESSVTPGVATFNPEAKTIGLRSSGGGILGRRDELYFVYKPVEGDARIRARVLMPPTQGVGRAGVMIRESLDPGARNLMLVRGGGSGLLFRSYRPSADGVTPASIDMDPGVGSQRPVWLQLIRQGNAIQYEFATDEAGTRFQRPGPAVTFDPPLARTLYVGLANTSTDRGRVSESRFTLPDVTEL